MHALRSSQCTGSKTQTPSPRQRVDGTGVAVVTACDAADEGLRLDGAGAAKRTEARTRIAPRNRDDIATGALEGKVHATGTITAASGVLVCTNARLSQRMRRRWTAALRVIPAPDSFAGRGRSGMRRKTSRTGSKGARPQAEDTRGVLRFR